MRKRANIRRPGDIVKPLDDLRDRASFENPHVRDFAPSLHALTHLPSGTDGLSVGTPISTGITNFIGSADAFARSDHRHATALLDSAGTPVTPFDGQIIYDTTDGIIKRYEASTASWVSFGPLSVKESDGSPVVSPVTTISFDGLSVVDSGSGVATVSAVPPDYPDTPYGRVIFNYDTGGNVGGLTAGALVYKESTTLSQLTVGLSNIAGVTEQGQRLLMYGSQTTGGNDTYMSIQGEHYVALDKLRAGVSKNYTPNPAIITPRTDIVAGYHAFIGTLSTTPLEFRTNDIGRMVILADGKVGIGIHNPLSDFQVTKNTGVNLDVRMENLATSGGTGSFFKFISTAGKYVGFNTIDNTSGDTSSWYFGQRGSTSCVIVDEINDKVVVSIQKGAPLNSLRVLATTGNVGLGIATPLYKLDVNGSVRIDNALTGILRADSGVISVDSTTLGGYVPTARTLTATSPITGGGDLSANRSFGFDFSTNNTWGGVQTLPASGLKIKSADGTTYGILAVAVHVSGDATYTFPYVGGTLATIDGYQNWTGRIGFSGDLNDCGLSYNDVNGTTNFRFTASTVSGGLKTIIFPYDSGTVLLSSNIGTSGTKLPYLDGTNTWSGRNAFSNAVDFTAYGNKTVNGHTVSGPLFIRNDLGVWAGANIVLANFGNDDAVDDAGYPYRLLWDYNTGGLTIDNGVGGTVSSFSGVNTGDNLANDQSWIGNNTYTQDVTFTQASGKLFVVNQSSFNSVKFAFYSNTSYLRGGQIWYRAGGTLASPSATDNGWWIGQLRFDAYTNSLLTMTCIQNSAWSGGAAESKWSWRWCHAASADDEQQIFYSQGGAVFNESGTGHANSAVRIEGDTDANLFYTDAINDRVGIGMNNPAYKLDVNGDIRLPAGNAYYVGTTAGVSGSFTTVDLKTVTVTKGIITAIV